MKFSIALLLISLVFSCSDESPINNNKNDIEYGHFDFLKPISAVNFYGVPNELSLSKSTWTPSVSNNTLALRYKIDSPSKTDKRIQITLDTINLIIDNIRISNTTYYNTKCLNDNYEVNNGYEYSISNLVFENIDNKIIILPTDSSKTYFEQQEKHVTYDIISARCKIGATNTILDEPDYSNFKIIFSKGDL